MLRRVLFCLGGALCGWTLLVSADDPPREWIEAATGHRVVRLSDQPGTASLYFHQNPYTGSGDLMVVSTPAGLATIALPSRTITSLVSGRTSHLVVGRGSRRAYYIQNDTVFAADLDTRTTRKILTDARLRTGSGFGVSADETLLAGSFVTDTGTGVTPPANTSAPPNPLVTPPPQASSLEARWAARRPMALYTLNVKSGELKIIYNATDWLNHVQMSPTAIRTDGSGRRLMHERTMDMEIAGHEFFSADGKTIWYDLQTPKSKVFWLAGVEIATGKRTRYPVAREDWSVHFNQSHDGRHFAGDGGGPRSVAAPGNGQWIYLFTPTADGKLAAERLVDLSKHDYQLEPNVTFTPDDKWVVFRSNMYGATHVYAVEVSGHR